MEKVEVNPQALEFFADSVKQMPDDFRWNLYPAAPIGCYIYTAMVVTSNRVCLGDHYLWWLHDYYFERDKSMKRCVIDTFKHAPVSTMSWIRMP